MDTEELFPIKTDKNKNERNITEKELISIAKGMKKDGFSVIEISKETGLPVSLITAVT